jgi:hypothetical protein
MTTSVQANEKVELLLPAACPRSHEQSFSLALIGLTLFFLSRPAQKEVYPEI